MLYLGNSWLEDEGKFDSDGDEVEEEEDEEYEEEDEEDDTAAPPPRKVFIQVSLDPFNCSK